MLISFRAACALWGAWVAAGDGCGDVGQHECPAGRRGDSYLQSELASAFVDDIVDEVWGAVKGMMYGNASLEAERVHEHTNATSDDVSGGRAMPNPSCLDETQQAAIPCDLDQNCDLWDTDYQCRWNVQWEMSDYILDLMEERGASPNLYKFKMCWDANSIDAEVRRFPWVQSAGTDWRYGLVVEGSIILTMMDQVKTWAENGLQNVLPDALEDYARKGEVDGFKIVPRFMLFGWSKGATYLLPIGRWRPDLVQAEILLHGCKSDKYAWDCKNMPQQAHNSGVVPFMFYSSQLDTFAGCTWKDTKKEFDRQYKKQKQTYLVESPCGHHPENCWPVCEYKKVYQETFWNFVAEAYAARQPCLNERKRSKCNDQLCIWDDEYEGTQFCEERYPSRLSKSCKRFCQKTEVASCAGLGTSDCGSSYRVLPAEEVGANGMFSSCKSVDGECVDSALSFQCFFQDQCEGGAQQPGRTGKGTAPQEGSYYDAYYAALEEGSSEMEEEEEIMEEEAADERDEGVDLPEEEEMMEEAERDEGEEATFSNDTDDVYAEEGEDSGDMMLEVGSNESLPEDGAVLAKEAVTEVDIDAADMEAARAIESELDVEYGDHDMHKIDIYWPADTSIMPENGWAAIFHLPGEGSRKESWKGICTKYIVPSGRLCVVADFRKSDKYRDGDVYDMTNWFHSKADRWKVDKANIVLGGISQGGLTINNVMWDKKMGKDLLQGSTPKLRAAMLLSGTWEHHKRLAKKAEYFPFSTYICSSDTDKSVPYKYSKDLAKELEKMEKPVKFVNIPDSGHAIWYSENKDEWYNELLTFLDETVPGVAKPSTPPPEAATTTSGTMTVSTTSTTTPECTEEYCCNGVRFNPVCCAASCGTCGGNGCQNLPGGAENCCKKDIEDAGRKCADKWDVVCLRP